MMENDLREMVPVHTSVFVWRFFGGQWSISLDFSQNQHCLEMFLGMVFRIHVNTNTEGHVARHAKGPNRSRTAGQLELVENHHLSHW